MKLLGRLSRLLLKKAPWPQGARPLGGTRSARRQRGKSRAAKKSLAHEKLPGRSPLQHVKTLCCPQPRRMGTRRTKLSVAQGPLWPRRAAAPSPPSYAASRGPPSSSLTCLLATTAL